MIVLIDGYWGSGKSVLRGLLDGHPNLFVSPIQDSLPGAFATDNSGIDWLKHKDSEYLRKLLAEKSLYYRIERFAMNQKMQLDFSSKNRTYIEIDIDFYKLDQKMINELVEKEAWDPELICTSIYKNMLHSWNNYPINSKNITAYVSMDNNRLNTLPYFIKHFKQGKLLYMLRSPEGIIATRANRRKIKEDFRTEAWERYTPEKLIKSGEVEKIIMHQSLARNIERQHPDRIKLIEFEDLILDTDSVMKDVTEFLGISDEKICRVFTHLGEEVTASGKKYVGKIYDTPKDLLDENVYKKIQLISEKHSLFTSPIKLLIKSVHKLNFRFNKYRNLAKIGFNKLKSN